MLYWNYDEVNVGFEVRAKIKPKSWRALGFSDYGELTNVDLCTYWTDLWGRQYLTKVHTNNASRITVDNNQSVYKT